MLSWFRITSCVAPRPLGRLPSFKPFSPGPILVSLLSVLWHTPHFASNNRFPATMSVCVGFVSSLRPEASWAGDAVTLRASQRPTSRIPNGFILPALLRQKLLDHLAFDIGKAELSPL